MKKLLLIGIAAALMAAQAGAAKADTPFYVGLNGDIARPAHSDITGSTTGSQAYGFSSGGDIAVGFTPEQLKSQDTGGVRLELQAGYHAFGLDRVTAGLVTNNSPNGDMKAATGFANAYYDFPGGMGFTPFLGAGVGMAHVTIPSGNGLNNTGGGDTRVAWQGMAGVAYTAPALPKADWTLGYRYLGIDAPSFSANGGDVKVSPVRENALEFGVRFHL